VKTKALLLSIVGVFVILLTFSIPFTNTCSLPRANAQINPCLEQEATLSAVNGLLLQATLDSISYRATISSLESQISSPTEIQGSELPFREDFNNNDRGWDILNSVGGVANIIDGQLRMTDAATPAYVLYFPDFEAPQQFYIEMSVKIVEVSEYDLGFWIGDYQAGQYHTFNLGYILGGVPGFRVIDGGNVVQELDVDAFDLIQPGRDQHLVGLELNGNDFRFYVDGASIASGQIVTYGGQLGIFINYRTTMEVDYIVVRSNR